VPVRRLHTIWIVVWCGEHFRVHFKRRAERGHLRVEAVEDGVEVRFCMYAVGQVEHCTQKGRAVVVRLAGAEGFGKRFECDTVV